MRTQAILERIAVIAHQHEPDRCVGVRLAPALGTDIAEIGMRYMSDGDPDCDRLDLIEGTEIIDIEDEARKDGLIGDLPDCLYDCSEDNNAYWFRVRLVPGHA